jgi:phosphatidylglycerol lysyltransferase
MLHLVRALRHVAPVAIMCGAAGLTLTLLQKLSRTLDYHTVTHELYALHLGPIAGAVAATLLGYAALVGQDAAILKFLGVRIKAPALVVGAICGSALGNIVGLGPLSGGAVRSRVYGAVGTSGEHVARLMAWIAVGCSFGLTMVAALDAVVWPTAIATMLRVPPSGVRTGGVVALCCGVGAIVLWRRRHPVLQLGRIASPWPTPGFARNLVALVSVHLLTAGATLWILLPHGKNAFLPFMAVFALATGLGALSRVPGGLGVFETAIMFGVSRSVPPSQVMASLIAYRLIYSFLPLLLSAGLLAAFELRAVSAQMASPGMARLKRGAGQLAPTMIGVVTFTIGVMLLLSGATPAFNHRLAILAMRLPLWVVESSQFVESLLGVVLLFVARGLSSRLDGAWWMATVIAALSLVLSLTKGLAFGEAGVLLCLVLLLIAARRLFNRPAWFLQDPFTPGWFVAIAAVIVFTVGMFLFAFRNVAYAHDLWWQFAFDAKAPRALRATMAAATLAGAIGLWQLLRLAPGRMRLPTEADFDRAAAIVRAQERSNALLAMMGDKSFLFNDAGTAFLMYAKRGRSWVALYDPVGNPSEWGELIQRFIAMAHRHGGRAAFYQVRPETLSAYLDAGLHLMKLGEEAWIDLDGFRMEGASRSNLRYALKRGPRDGLTFTIIPESEAAAAIPVLQDISDGWLRSRGAKEKGFSVAGFEPRYVASQSVALVSQDGRPVGFATFMTTGLRTEATVGVMRHLPDASAYAMEFLFTQLALELKRSGFRRLSLGVAPLAGLASTPLSSAWHRVGGLVWRHGNKLYDFQGLRRFKNKFSPVWEPRYLAASGTVGQFVALADVVALTGARSEPKWAA